jgi:flagellar basal body-associated protein FliL
MNRKIFFLVNLIVFSLMIFSFSGCLSLGKSNTDSYVGTSEVSYSVEKGAVKTSEVSGNIFWYDPFGTISSVLKDGKVCEIEISIGYDSADRDFLLQFTKKRMDVFNEVVKYLSKQNSKYLVIENADNIEEELFSVINKICKDTCPIYQIKIIRLETF